MTFPQQPGQQTPGPWPLHGPPAPDWRPPPMAPAGPPPGTPPGMVPTPPAPTELPRASRFLRLLARTLDYALATALVIPFWFLAYNYLQGKAADLQNTTFQKTFWALLRGDADKAQRAPLDTVDGLWDQTKVILLLLILAHLLLPTLYDWLMHAFLGRTLGKMMLGMKVVPQSGGSSRLGLARSGRRTLVAVFVPWAALMLMWYELILRQWTLAVVCGIVSLIGFLDPLAVLGPRRRAWHDRAAGTVVVNVKLLARAAELGRGAGSAARQAYQSSAIPGQVSRLGTSASEQARNARERLRRRRG